jgi:hypothetical protein
VDCKLKICEIMRESRVCRANKLMNELLCLGAKKNEIIDSLKVLQERGVIYKKKGGLIELTEPLKS